MSYTVKLMLAVGAGVLGFLLNMLVVSRAIDRETATVELTVAQADIEIDEPFTAEKLASVKLPKRDAERLQKSVVPWSEKGSAFAGQKAHRRITADEFIFWNDVTPPPVVPQIALEPDEVALLVSLDGVAYEPELLTVGNQIGFVVQSASGGKAPEGAVSADGGVQVLGPFRVTSVGAEVEKPALSEDGRQIPGDSHVVSVAIPRQPSGQLASDVRRLVSAIGRNSRNEQRISHLVMFGEATAPTPTSDKVSTVKRGR